MVLRRDSRRCCSRSLGYYFLVTMTLQLCTHFQAPTTTTISAFVPAQPLTTSRRRRNSHSLQQQYGFHQNTINERYLSRNILKSSSLQQQQQQRRRRHRHQLPVQQLRQHDGGLFQSASVVENHTTALSSELSPLMTNMVRIGMMTFIAAMCLALPLTLYPQKLLYRLGIIDRVKKERWALATGQFCARTLLRIIPFCTIETSKSPEYDMNPKRCQSVFQPTQKSSVVDHCRTRVAHHYYYYCHCYQQGSSV